MVDVGAKAATERFAHARALVRLPPTQRRALRSATLRKGDAFAAAQIAGIFAAKNTAGLIPLAHHAAAERRSTSRSRGRKRRVLQIDASARTTAQTGVEMEAMVAASVAALTIYDMTKSLGKDIAIESVRLLEKRGGKSGAWRARDPPEPARVACATTWPSSCCRIGSPQASAATGAFRPSRQALGDGFAIVHTSACCPTIPPRCKRN